MPVTEFELIKRYFKRQVTRRKDVVVGIGDDAAVLKVAFDRELVVTTDTLISGVHFPEDLTPQDIGYRCLAVSLSDIAAMGAEPMWATLALSMPDADEAWLGAFSEAFFKLADEFSLQLVGGDLTRGPLVITVHVHASVPVGAALTRRGARPDDLIYVTGTIGDAAAALQQSRTCDLVTIPVARELAVRLARPSPRVVEGISLRGVASSAIDISDGLMADLGHVLAASGVGGRVQIPLLPLSRAVRTISDPQLRWRLALTGGDDYELCFTAPSHHRTKVEALFAGSQCGATYIGTIDVEPGLRCLTADGKQFDPDSLGYQHF